jgi:hypothetical protein
MTKAVNGPQRRHAGTDHKSRADQQPKGGNVGWLERECVVHIIDDGHQHVVVHLHPGGARTVTQGLIEHFRQVGIPRQPLRRCTMCEVEMDPDEATGLDRPGNPLPGIER